MFVCEEQPTTERTPNMEQEVVGEEHQRLVREQRNSALRYLITIVVLGAHVRVCLLLVEFPLANIPT